MDEFKELISAAETLEKSDDSYVSLMGLKAKQHLEKSQPEPPAQDQMQG